MAGSIAVTSADLGGGYTRHSVAWVSDAAGAVSGNTVPLPRGHIHRVTFVPDAGGTQPTNLYDATLPDEYGVDLLNGTGANLSNAAAAHFVPLMGNGTTLNQRLWHGGGAVTPTIAAAGNAKGGTLHIVVGP